MKLVNEVDIKPIYIDKRFGDKLTIKATAEIGEKISELFTLSTRAIADQLESEKIEIRKCNCIFTNQNEMKFVLDDNEWGESIHFCIYPFDRWDEFSDITILLVIIEELAHFYWSTNDEYKIALKVHEIMQRIYPNIDISLLYNKEWLDKNKPEEE